MSKAYASMSREELLSLKDELDKEFQGYKEKGLKLDMSRGKPSIAQLNLSMGMMDVLNSTTDLHLAYNNVNYSATGVKSNGKWTLTITFTDTYDFDAQSWKNAMTDNALVTILNNYAAYAQSIGAIVPYNVTVTVQTTF